MPELLTSEILNEPEKILLYGGPKTGKTFLAGTAPGDLYCLVIGPRNELKVLASPAFRSRYPHKRVMYDYVLEQLGLRGQFEEATAYDIACDRLDDALELRRKGDMPFDTLIVENATTLMEVEMNKAIEINYSLGGDGGKAKKALTKLRDQNIVKPGDDDWGSAQSLMTQFINWVFKLDLNVIFIAHEWIVETQDRQTKNKVVHAILPSFVGKQRTEIARAFDNVWRVTLEGGGRGVRQVLTTLGTEGGGSAPTIVAGTRIGGILPEKLYDADIEKIIDRLKTADDSWSPSRVDYDEFRNRTVITR